LQNIQPLKLKEFKKRKLIHQHSVLATQDFVTLDKSVRENFPKQLTIHSHVTLGPISISSSQKRSYKNYEVNFNYENNLAPFTYIILYALIEETKWYNELYFCSKLS